MATFQATFQEILSNLWTELSLETDKEARFPGIRGLGTYDLDPAAGFQTRDQRGK